MFSWFDIAYATLDILVVFYCFKNYFSSKKRAFQLFGLGFTSLIISDFVWAFAVIPWLDSLMPLWGYVRLGLYASFIVLILRALQLSDSSSQANTKQS
jgi:hypothetical protein